jgi:hypothetical protein
VYSLQYSYNAIQAPFETDVFEFARSLGISELYGLDMLILAMISQTTASEGQVVATRTLSTAGLSTLSCA